MLDGRLCEVLHDMLDEDWRVMLDEALCKGVVDKGDDIEDLLDAACVRIKLDVASCAKII